MFEIVKRVTSLPVQFGGEQHTGWLPAGAAVPLPTPAIDVFLDIEIQSDGDGYLLCYSSQGGTVHGDTWHQSVNPPTIKTGDDLSVVQLLPNIP